MIDLYPNETLPILWGLFLVVLFFLYYWVFKPTLNIIEARKGSTDLLQGKTQKIIDANVQSLAVYEKKIAEARNQASLERDRIIKEGRKVETEIIAKARIEAEKMVQDMQKKLSEEREESLQRLNKYAQQMAIDAANRILERVA